MLTACTAPAPRPTPDAPELRVSAAQLEQGPLHTVLPVLAARAVERGATLVIPHGRYTTTESVLLPEAVHLRMTAGAVITGNLPGKPLLRLGAQSTLSGGTIWNTSQDPGFDVDLAQDAQQVRIEGVTFRGPSVNALYLATTELQNIVISGNRFQSVGYGVLLNPPALDARSITIRGNTFVDACADPIEINAATGGTTARVRDVTVTGNRISGTCGDGPSSGLAIGMAGVDGFLVADNMIDGARNEAVHLEDGTTRGVVRGNRVTGGGHGDRPAIALYRATSDVLITRNTVDRFSGGGIAVRWDTMGSASRVTITANRLQDITGTGIVVSGGSGTGPFVVRGNRLSGIDGVGIAVIGSHELSTVEGNRLEDVTGAPVEQVIRGAGTTVLKDNVVR